MRRSGLAALAVGACVSFSRGAVDMNIGQCLAAGDQPVVNYKNNTPDHWDMRAFKATVNNNVLGASFPNDPTRNNKVVPPGQSARPPDYFSCGQNVGVFTNRQLMAKTGSCNEPDPPKEPLPLTCGEVTTPANFYKIDQCLPDGLGVNRGDGYGGFIDSWRDQTQIQLPIPPEPFTLVGSSQQVRFDPASMGGPFYFMAMAALQEYLYVDMQFLLAMGASTSRAALVDANTGASLYLPGGNTGTDTAAYGSFKVTEATFRGRILKDYPKYFSTNDLGRMVSEDGFNATPANSPTQLNSGFLAAMNLWWLFDGLKAAQDLCFRQFLRDARDKGAGLKLMLGGYHIGPNAVQNGTSSSQDYAFHVLPITPARQATLTDDDVTGKMKPFVWGGPASPDYNNQNYITRVFATLNHLLAAGPNATSCGRSVPLYDAGIKIPQIKMLFFGINGTAANQGNGGLLWHFKIDNAARQSLWNDLDCAFNKLKGKAPGRAADEISFRYDYLTILRVARSYFPGYINKFTDRPTPSDASSSEYSIWVFNHSQKPCTQSTQDDVWPTIALSDSVFGKGSPIQGSFTDAGGTGIKEYAYTSDTQWRNWVAVTPPVIIPSTLADNDSVWLRITDSCGNSTIQQIKIKTLPKLASPVANPPGGNFFNTVTVTLDVPGVTGEKIYYTIDGSTPTAASPQATPGTPITIPATADFTLKAYATANGYAQSDVASWNFTKVAMPVTATPTANPPSRDFTTLDPDFQVTLSGEAGSTIHYTTDNSTPTTSSPVYSGPITVSTTTTIKAMAVKANQLPSGVMTAQYNETQAPKVATPVATPPGAAGTSPYSFTTAPLQVTLTTSTPGATITYTLDGGAAQTVPSGGTVTLTGSGTLKAHAVKAGMLDSDPITIQYTYTPPVAVVKAWYQDKDGNGEIETAHIVFDKDLVELPKTLTFTIVDQAGRTETRTANGAQIAREGSQGVLVTLAEPFTKGITSVTNVSQSGRTHAQTGPTPLSDATFPVADSVAPVLMAAWIDPADSASPYIRVKLTFSEAVTAPAVSQTAFTFKRGDQVIPAANIVVNQIQKTGNLEYTVFIEVASAQPPIRTDSVAISAPGLGEVKDQVGNAPQRPLFEVIKGNPVLAKPTDIQVRFWNDGREPGKETPPEPSGMTAEKVFIPISAVGTPLQGDAKDGKCGACEVGADGRFVGPVLRMEIPGPVSYEFSIFDNLGAFVVSGKGRITEADLVLLGPGKGQNKVARVIWTGKTAAGSKAGTGAFVLVSKITTEKDPRTGAEPSTRLKRLIFGMLRPFRG